MLFAHFFTYIYVFESSLKLFLTISVFYIRLVLLSAKSKIHSLEVWQKPASGVKKLKLDV